jgi:transposase-like protein
MNPAPAPQPAAEKQPAALSCVVNRHRFQLLCSEWTQKGGSDSAGCSCSFRLRNCSIVCLKCGISRPTLRKWLRRYEDKGTEGLIGESRKPKSSPATKILVQHLEWIRELRNRCLGSRRIQSEPTSSRLRRVPHDNRQNSTGHGCQTVVATPSPSEGQQQVRQTHPRRADSDGHLQNRDLSQTR